MRNGADVNLFKWHQQQFTVVTNKITNSTVAFEILWDGRFTHGGRINWEFGTLYEFPDFFPDVMANCTRIDEDDYFMTSLLHELLDSVKNKVFFS